MPAEKSLAYIWLYGSDLIQYELPYSTRPLASLDASMENKKRINIRPNQDKITARISESACNASFSSKDA